MYALRNASIVFALMLSLAAGAQSIRSEILVQRSLAAGLRHHEAKSVWSSMSVGDEVELVREPTNPEDANAVRIEWEGFKLGYLPRGENEAIARQLDRGAALRARIVELAKYRNHRLKLGLDIFLPL